MALKLNPITGEFDLVMNPGSGVATTDFTADSGSAVPTAAGVITISGGTGITTSAASNTVTFSLDTPVSVANGGTGASTLTDGGVLLGSGTSAITPLGQATNGQLVIGSTGADPVLATLTAGANIAINNSAGGIEIVGTATGDVVGPASSTDNAIVRFDSTTGKLVQDSVVIIDDVGVTTGITQLDVDNLRLDGNTLSSTDTNGDINLTPDGTGQVVSGGEFVAPDGAFNNPSITFSSDNTSGFALNGAGNLVAVASGGLAMTWSSTQIATNKDITGNSTGRFRIDVTGTSESLPSYGFHNDTSTGMYRESAGVLAFTTSGTKALDISSSQIMNLVNPLPVASGGYGIARTPSRGPLYQNLGITYSAGTFTIEGADGNTLSATNPATIILPSKAAPGAFTEYTITSDQNFIDDAGSSEIINNLFGFTTGVAETNDVPFFIYAVTNDAENAIQFMISRVPHATISPAAANIGAPDDAVADATTDFWSLDNIDETLYDSNPCLCIGSFRMQMSALDDWTVQALSTDDGIGRFQENNNFTWSAGHFGAASGKYFKDNGGTAPSFSGNTVGYTLSKDGTCQIWYNFSGATAGTGAVDTILATPFLSRSAQQLGPVRYNDNSAGTFVSGSGEVDTSNGMRFLVNAINTGGFFDNDEVDTSDGMVGSVIFPVEV